MKTFNDGLAAASALLRRTADDYIQMAVQAERDLGRTDAIEYRRRSRNADELREKAQLLRGQATTIMGLAE